MSDVELEAETWVEWFCNLRGNEFLCEVDQSYIGASARRFSHERGGVS